MSDDTFSTSNKPTDLPPEREGCRHNKLRSKVNLVATDDGFYMVEITVQCKKCDHPFRFRGLPRGLNLQGAAVSPLDTEARLAIEPLEVDPLGRRVAI